MKTDDFDYDLPPRLIAQTPADKRRNSRLLVVGHEPEFLLDEHFANFNSFCQPGDLIVMNNTRVIPARLQCNKPSGGKVEVMLERCLSANTFLALAKSNKQLKPGQVLQIDGQDKLKYLERSGAFFKFELFDTNDDDVHTLLEQYGDIPLPPYIKRSPDKNDQQRYQTVYAKENGAVAAPTAGLHFDEKILTEIQLKGVDVAQITLHVGAGTFQPVKVENVSEHRMHQEWLEVSAETVSMIEKTKARGGRVIAIGTTTVRALETAAQSGVLKSYSGLTEIFIYPGFKFRVVDALLTNFHLPKSTLLMMISAFAGRETVRMAYTHATKNEYRFFSFGDAMLLFPDNKLATSNGGNLSE